MTHYNNYIDFTGSSPQNIEDWKTTYLSLLKKITMYHQGKQLILKNQDNTGKILQLLEMFPDAKFIYMYRNPYDLYMSMLKFMRKVIPLYCVQTPPPLKDVEDHMMTLFTHMTKKYIQDKPLIPKENLMEVRYENFIDEPLDIVSTPYNKFSLNGYRDIEPSMNSYLTTQKTIHMDKYNFTDSIKKKIENHWGFALTEYEYTRPQEEVS
ncbi:MAG TPA: sulfotransferase [Thermoplasmata archaeon]|nr:sulfotransferase [Thermoplasmata archaeon]